MPSQNTPGCGCTVGFVQHLLSEKPGHVASRPWEHLVLSLPHPMAIVTLLTVLTVTMRKLALEFVLQMVTDGLLSLDGQDHFRQTQLGSIKQPSFCLQKGLCGTKCVVWGQACLYASAHLCKLLSYIHIP